MLKIAMGMQKGGVGKTTTTSLLAEILAASGYKTLVIDMDSQGNTTRFLTGRSIYEFTGNTILEAIKNKDPDKYLVQISENLFLLPAEDMLATFSRYIYTNQFKEPAKVLSNAMDRMKTDFDIVLMDLPPQLGDQVVNAVSYADYVIVPVQPEPLCLEALDRFVMMIESAKAAGRTNAELLGLAFTMVDKRNSLQKSIIQMVTEQYSDLVFNSKIYTRAKLKEFSLNKIQMGKNADMKAITDYINLATEIVKRIQEREEAIHGKRQI